jgi:hypothetical protein
MAASLFACKWYASGTRDHIDLQLPASPTSRLNFDDYFGCHKCFAIDMAKITTDAVQVFRCARSAGWSSLGADVTAVARPLALAN